MTTSDAPLADTTFLTALLDTLIPPSEDGKLPGAGSLGLASEIAAAIEGNARVAPVVEAGLEAIRAAGDGGFAALDLSARVAAIEAQQEAHPRLIPSIITPLYFAYYQHPVVLMGLGLPARPPFPGGYEVTATDPDLLELLNTRGRQASASDGAS